jgi:integrase
MTPEPGGHRSDGDQAYLDQARQAADRFAEASTAKGTLIAYRSGWRDFETWCGILRLTALPAEPETVAAYLASARRGEAQGLDHPQPQGRDRLEAPGRAGHETPTTARAVTKTMRGLNRSIGTASDQKAPATDDVLQRVLSQIGTHRSKDLRDRALLSLGFAAALRRSELVGSTSRIIQRVREGAIVHIRRSKTDQEGKGHQVPVPKGTHMRPLRMLDAYLTAAEISSGRSSARVDQAGRMGGRLSPAERGADPQEARSRPPASTPRSSPATRCAQASSLRRSSTAPTSSPRPTTPGTRSSRRPAATTSAASCSRTPRAKDFCDADDPGSMVPLVVLRRLRLRPLDPRQRPDDEEHPWPIETTTAARTWAYA